MKNIFQGMIMAIAVLSFVTFGWAETIKGELEKIDEKGSFYHVVDATGKEHRIHFDKTTKKEGDVKVGVQVEVDEEKGHAKSIEVEEEKK